MLDRRAYRLALVAGLITLGACADVGGADTDAPSDAGYSPGSTSTGSSSGSYDAGSKPWLDGGTPSSSSSTGSTGGGNNGVNLTVNDAAVGLDDLLNAGGSLFGGASDGGSSAPSAPKGDAGAQCQNAVCFDVFDCYLFHPDLTDCGFTACEGFVCK